MIYAPSMYTFPPMFAVLLAAVVEWTSAIQTFAALKPDAPIAVSTNNTVSLLKREIDDQKETIHDLREGLNTIRDLVAQTVPPSGRGLLVDLKAALTPRSTTAPSTQHEPGETAHDNSAAQTAATAG